MDSSLLCFDQFQLDLGARELRCARGPRPLEPRLLSVLAYLIQHRERVIPAPELIRRVWRLRRLGPSSVPTAIGALRRALGDDPRRPRFIRTFTRAGYRFVAELRAAPAPAREPEWDALSLDPALAVRVRPLLARVVRLLGPAAGERPLVLILTPEARAAGTVVSLIQTLAESPAARACPAVA